jgi:hypothetical protein
MLSLLSAHHRWKNWDHQVVWLGLKFRSSYSSYFIGLDCAVFQTKYSLLWKLEAFFIQKSTVLDFLLDKIKDFGSSPFQIIQLLFQMSLKSKWWMEWNQHLGKLIAPRDINASLFTLILKRSHESNSKLADRVCWGGLLTTSKTTLVSF